jgi:NADPH:quinone reductase
MRAVLCKEFGTIDDLEVGQLPEPQPGPDEVLVQVHAAGVNFPDVLIVQGRYQFKPECPFVPGNEIAGVVIAVGSKVRSVRVGARVIAAMLWGAFAERVAIAAEQVFELPESIPFATGAGLITAYATTIYALQERAGLKPGDTLAVLGAAGGVGLAAVQIGKQLGARVIACASSAEKLALCSRHGADACINYQQSDLKNSLKQHSGGGVDVVYDPVGGQHSEAALRALAPNGRLLVVGFASGDIPKIPLNLVLLKSCQIVGVFWGAFTQRKPQEHRRLFEQVLQWVASGNVQPHIGKVYPMSQASEALRALAERRAQGKLILNLSEGE